MKFRPHETAFIDLPDPKAILERELTNYATVFQGDTISIDHMGRAYLIDVIECRPKPQICIVEADVNLDFEAPLDYVEPAPVHKQVNAGVQGGSKVGGNKAPGVGDMEAKREEIKKMYKRLDG